MPGVRMRSLPEASASLILSTESVGWAMKNRLMGMDEPGVAPLAHVVPTELRCTAGTKTLKCPVASKYRYGASRVIGLLASVVYGPPHDAWLGKHWAGAPTTPENTWFQTPLLQPSRLLFLTIHCCCEPLTMVLPSNSESAMKPPLAKDGGVQKSIRVVNPLMWTRRIGAACDTAQNSPVEQPAFGVVTLMVRFDNERQKFTSAMQLLGPRHWLRTSMDPLMTTSFGERPRPATAV